MLLIGSRAKFNILTLCLKPFDTTALAGGGGQNRLHNWVLTLFAHFDTADNYSFQWKIETGQRKIVNSISTLITPPAIVTHYVHTIASSPSREEIRGLSAPDGERIASRGWRVLQETKSRSKTWNCRLMRATKQVSHRDEGEMCKEVLC